MSHKVIVNYVFGCTVLIILSVEPSLFYLLSDLEDPVFAWKKLSDQFQKMWANKLEMRRLHF